MSSLLLIQLQTKRAHSRSCPQFTKEQRNSTYTTTRNVNTLEKQFNHLKFKQHVFHIKLQFGEGNRYCFYIITSQYLCETRKLGCNWTLITITWKHRFVSPKNQNGQQVFIELDQVLYVIDLSLTHLWYTHWGIKTNCVWNLDSMKGNHQFFRLNA